MFLPVMNYSLQYCSSGKDKISAVIFSLLLDLLLRHFVSLTLWEVTGGGGKGNPQVAINPELNLCKNHFT